MAKNWDPKAPPMTLAESQRLLDAETARIQSNARWAKDLVGIGFLLWVAVVWIIKIGLAFLVLRFVLRHLL